MRIMDNKDFNKIVIDNIKMFARKEKIPIGKLEEEFGASVGYLSRTQKNNANINSYFMYVATKLLNISMEDLLVEYDWELMELQEKAKELGYKLIKEEK